MAFSEEIKIKAMVACGRRCCVCHKFCGNNMEAHHIKAHADGGADVFENAIPLCFDCHAIVRQYDTKHPKGIKFTEKELIMHRDSCYKKMEQEDIDIGPKCLTVEFLLADPLLIIGREWSHWNVVVKQNGKMVTVL